MKECYGYSYKHFYTCTEYNKFVLMVMVMVINGYGYYDGYGYGYKHLYTCIEYNKFVLNVKVALSVCSANWVSIFTFFPLKEISYLVSVKDLIIT